MPIAIDKESGKAVYLADDGQWTPAPTAQHPQTKQTMIFDGKAWVQTPVRQDYTVGKLAEDTVRSLASGATFGFADEIAAKADTAFGTGAGKPTYEENLAAQTARDKEIPPAVKIPGEVAGAVAGTLATAPIRAPLAAAAGVEALPAWLRGVVGGATGGALFGSGEAEPGQRLEGAVKGGAIGGLAGGIVPKAVDALAGTANAVRGAVQPSANVAADLGRAIKRDTMAPEELLARYNELKGIRPGVATLADAGGENVKGLVERIAQTPGAGRTVMIPALTDRQRGQMTRVSTDLRDLTGTRQTATQAIGETMEQRAKDSTPLYDEAFNFNARAVPEIVQAWNEATSTGWGKSLLMRPDFRKNLQTEYGITDPKDAPFMVVIDTWKKTVDDAIKNNLGTNQARIMRDMRQKVLDVVDQHNPKYAEARNAWAGPSQYLDAIGEGRNIFSTKISGEELTSALGAMSDVQREAYRIGAISAITGKMGNDPAKLADMTKYLRSPEMREKIAAMMPTLEARQKWAQRLDFEVASSELTGRALGNSATARRLAERGDSESIVGDLVMDAFMGHPPVSLLRRAITAVPQKIRDTLRSRSDHILAELLTDQPTMQGLQQAIERVTARNAPPSVVRNPAAVNAANAGMTSGGVPGMLPATPFMGGGQ